MIFQDLKYLFFRAMIRPQIVNVNSVEHAFFLLVLKQVNAVVVVTISMNHMQNCVFLMLLRILILKYSN